jgi:hypothetical protein
MSKGEKGVEFEMFGNRFEPDWLNAEKSLNGRMQRRVESECKCCHQCQRGRLLAISVNRKQISVYLSLMASTVVIAVMTIAMNSSAAIIGRRRVSDRRISFKFPERTRAVRSVEVAREISHRRIGDRDFEMSSSLDNENPEIAICDFAI